jgi:hemoglobin
MNAWRMRLAVLLVAMLIGACHGGPAPKSVAAAPPSQAAPAAAADTTLYARLGGEAGIQAIAAGLAGRIATDGRVNPFFADTDMKGFQSNLANFIAQSCGGPALYHGPDMKTVHADLGIADPQFDAVIEDLGAVLDQRQVAAADRAALIGRLEPLREAIVKH